MKKLFIKDKVWPVMILVLTPFILMSLKQSQLEVEESWGYGQWQYESKIQLHSDLDKAAYLVKNTGDKEFEYMALWTTYKIECFNDSLRSGVHRIPNTEGFLQFRLDEMRKFYLHKLKRK